MKKLDFEALANSLLTCPAIDFSTVFGSSANGFLPDMDSDIDIAVYLSTDPTPDLLAEIIGLCQDSLSFEHIDLVVLNASDPVLAFEALCGKLVICKNEESYQSFFSRTCRLYEDKTYRNKKYLSL
jgi:predicted nucleotidyltransferase